MSAAADAREGSRLVDLFEGMAERRPTAPAITDSSGSWDYAALARAARRVAARLHARGVGRGDVVGVQIPRSRGQVAAVLGVLRAGAACLPLDPEYPAERLRFMREDGGARVVLGPDDVAGLDEDPPAAADESAEEAPPCPAQADDLAYVLYTSGSTGRPKGVAMPHDPLVRLMRWQCAQSVTGPGDRTLQFAPLGFDVSFQEIFATLAAGGELVLPAERDRLDPDRLWNLLDEQCIARLFLPFIALQQLADAAARRTTLPDTLREVITAGEQLQVRDTLRDLFARLPGALLVNQYGPTETHVVTAHALTGASETWPELPPIGRPLPHVATRVAHESTGEEGEEGELWIGGPCLARGYVGLEDETGRRFVTDEQGRRWYRTGDRVRAASDGTLEFRGRADRQLKVRGYRIEPGEIEVALAAHPAVGDVAVVARSVGADPAAQDSATSAASGDLRLVAYVTASGSEAPRVSAMRDWLEQRLPPHCVPALFVTVDALPRTPSGKVDRDALPEPLRERPALDAEYAAPRGETERRLAALWAEMLGVDRVGARDSFFELGGDSLSCVRMVRRVREELGHELDVVVPFQAPTIRALREHLEGSAVDDATGGDPSATSASSVARARPAPAGGDVAVVGMAVRLPGAPDVESFWRNLEQGVESIRRFSDEELAAAGVPEELRRDPEYVPAKALMDDPEGFDAAFFGVRPREAELMDPQHRVFLETCWEALEDAGHAPGTLGGAVGVWGGLSTGMRDDTYLARVIRAEGARLSQAERVAAMLGNQNDYLTTRVSHKLDLRGPSVDVQTACSTSLTAIAEACAALRSGACDVGLAGGVCILYPQVQGYLHQEGDIASADGHCRPFDAEADGTVFGDGAGVVVLKRLEDAVADGDTIHAVIKGAAVNNDGADKMSFGAPSPRGQTEVIRRALADARVEPATVGFVEAHGTGTALGDPVELRGLLAAFGDAPPERCWLGSVKSNFGHLIAAAGVASFVKAVLALERRRVPPTVHFSDPHPDLRLDDTPFRVNARAEAWEVGEGPRRAGVSSFGLGGTNAHVILEEAPPVPAPAPEPRAAVIPLSARTPAALDVATARLAEHCAAHSEQSLGDVAHTLQHGRAAFAHRRIVVARDLGDAAEALRARDPRRTFTAEAAGDPAVAFLFPGGGAQYPGMARGLFETQPLFRESVERGLAAARDGLGLDLRRPWFPDQGAEEEAAQALLRPSLQLPALYVIEVALAELWRAWGIEPQALLGHSNGEYAAAHLAGCFSYEEGLGLVALRGRLFEQVPDGGMLSVSMSEKALRPLLGDDLDLAVVNAPEACIASGPRAALDALATRLEEEGVDAQPVRISIAAHSRMLDPILDEFLAHVSGIDLKPPRIPIASNRTGAWLRDDEATSPGYWVEHLRHTVRFADGLGLLLQDPERVLLEVGPGKTLSSLARLQLDPRGRQSAVPSMRHADDEGDDQVLALEAMGRLWAAGCAPRWEAALPRVGRRRVPLPTYPFERKRYFFGDGAVPLAEEAEDPRAAAAADGAREALPEEQPHAETAPAVEYANRYEVILARLRATLADLSGTPAEELDAEAPFLEMGFDSLFLTQATLAFKRDFPVKLSFRQLFGDAPSLAALARYVDGELDADAAVEPPQAPAAERSRTRTTDDGDGLRFRPTEEVTDKPKRFGPYKPIEKGADGGLTEHQQRHLDALIAQVLERTPGSKELTARHRDHFADPRAVGGFKTLWKEIVYPIAVERSKGARMWDVDGNEYVDCVGGFGAIYFGHAPDFLVEAVDRQLHHNIDYGPTSTLAGDLARRICAMTGMERAGFCNTGSEAVLACMRLARTTTGREKIVTFTGDYHGIFDEVLVRAQQVGDRRRNVPVAPGIPRDASANMIVLEYGDPASLDAIRDLGDELAGVLVEPVQSRAPDLQPREFVQRLRRLTEELGVPLIFDEIITGFRTGPRGAQGHYGVQADLAAYGKVIGGGMPTGVVAGKAQYMDGLDGGTWRYGDDSFPEAGVTYFAGTFVRHPLALAAMTAVMDEMEREGEALQRAVNMRCAAFAAELNDAFERERIPIRILHFASVILPSWGGDPEFEGLFYHHLRLRGVHVWEGRPAFMTTAHTDEDFALLLERFQEAAHAVVEGGFLKRLDAPAAAPEEVPLTEAQQELWLLTRAGEDASRSLNEPCAFRLEGALNVPVLRRALRQVVRRHDALRATVSEDGERFLVHPQPGDVPLRVVDLRNLGESERAARREALYRDDSREIFDLQQAPLMRATLLRLEDDLQELLITVHHLVCDGWSIAILFQDLSQLYTLALEGRTRELPPAMKMAEYRAWEEENAASEEHAATRAFWEERFRELPPALELPLDHERPRVRSFRGNRFHLTVEPEVGEALKRFSAEHQCTLFSTLLAAYAAFLQRLTGERDLVIGIPSAGQALLGANNLMAHCVHYLPFRVGVDAEEPFAALVERIAAEMLEANEHQDYTYGTLLQSVSMPRDPSRPTLVATDFNVDPEMGDVRFGDLAARYVSTPRDFARLELQVNVIEEDGALLVECDHARDLIEEGTARRWMEGFAEMLRAVARAARTPVAALPDPAAGSAAGAPVPDSWTCRALGIPRDGTLHGQVARQAAATPDALALVDGDERWTYAELDGAANGLAARLQSAGVKAGARVGLHLHRGAPLVVAQLATMKAGAAFVPLDPTYPDARLQAILEDAACSVVLTDGTDAMPAAGAEVHAVDAAVLRAEARDETPQPAGDPGALAYLIHTSGSTGRPKGVMIEQGAAAHLAQAFAAEIGLSATERWLAVISPSFDMAISEVYAPLCRGAAVVLAPGDRALGGEDLLELARSEEVDVIQATPSLWRALVEAGWSRAHGIRRAIAGGEALTPALARAMAERADEVWNAYGPTEVTVYATAGRVSPDDEVVSIGRPLPDVEAHVLDDAGRPVPVGAVGELHVGGPQLARGYLGMEEETARRFVTSEHVGGGATRLYRTGDLARWRDDGTLQCLGRNDAQVKVRGYRVELGEVERALEDCAGVEQAVAGVLDDDSGRATLVAWVRGGAHASGNGGGDADGAAPSAEHLRARLAERLPAYMIPQAIAAVDAFPKLPNGKLDRGALPDPLRAVQRRAGAGGPPRSDVERRVAEAWRALLEVEEVGLDDDFFLLGGHSLLAARMLTRLEEECGVELALQEVFLHPTVRGLAEVVERAQARGGREEFTL